jgi:hypothetical protein
MTSREKLLLRLLALTLVLSLALAGTQIYLDELTRLDQKFATLQKSAVRLQQQHLAALETKRSAEQDAGEISRLWPKATALDPVSLAKTIQPALVRAGIEVVEFQITIEKVNEICLRYTFETTMERFLSLSHRLRQDDQHLIVRTLSISQKSASSYTIVWEVGYAVVP